MWPFSSKKSLSSSGVLRGATDWHCHLLPGVDDGLRTLDETLTALHCYAEAGIKDVWFTPHIMEEMPNTTSLLRQRFAEVQQAWSEAANPSGDEGLRLHLAAEHMLDNLFQERLCQEDVLPIGEEGNMLLVETSYYNPPFDLWSIIYDIQCAGYKVLLAHPERYQYMEQADYDRLHDMGVLFQLNLPSLAGAYGPEPKARANKLLAVDYYHFKGTDTHRISRFEQVLEEKCLSESCQKQISKLL